MRYLLRIADSGRKAKEVVQSFVFLVERKALLRPCVRVTRRRGCTQWYGSRYAYSTRDG